MISEYFRSVKAVIENLDWLINQSELEIENDDEIQIGKISGRLIFKDGSIFHFKELHLQKGRRYRFHYMDENENLIIRWDDAPHHQDLKTFPFHIHFPDAVMESEPIQLIQALNKIEEMVIEKLLKSTKENFDRF